MNEQKPEAVQAAQREMVITRIFDAPRELVFQAWTDPEHLVRWWGPQYFTSPVCKVDLRVGGKYLFCMRSPEGQDFWSGGTYLEIVPPERLVYTDHFADEHGNILPASTFGMGPDYPDETKIVVTFEDLDGKTKLTLRGAAPEGEMREMALAGWNSSLDKLAESLK